MSLPISSLFFAFFGVFLFTLSILVIFRRRELKVAVGDQGDERLIRRMRAQGNFCEYTPTFLICLLIAELQGFDSAVLVLLATLFLLGRLLHAIALYRAILILRQVGMALTFVSLLGLCFGLLLDSIWMA